MKKQVKMYEHNDHKKYHYHKRRYDNGKYIHNLNHTGNCDNRSSTFGRNDFGNGQNNRNNINYNKKTTKYNLVHSYTNNSKLMVTQNSLKEDKLLSIHNLKYNKTSYRNKIIEGTNKRTKSRYSNEYTILPTSNEPKNMHYASRYNVSRYEPNLKKHQLKDSQNRYAKQISSINEINKTKDAFFASKIRLMNGPQTKSNNLKLTKVFKNMSAMSDHYLNTKNQAIEAINLCLSKDESLKNSNNNGISNVDKNISFIPELKIDKQINDIDKAYVNLANSGNIQLETNKNASKTDELSVISGASFEKYDYENANNPSLLKTDILRLKESFVHFTDTQVLPDTKEGYIYPLNSLQCRLLNLKLNLPKARKNFKYLLSAPIDSMYTYNFFEKNITQHKLELRKLIFQKLNSLNQNFVGKNLLINKKFLISSECWNLHCKNLEKEIDQKKLKQNLNNCAFKNDNIFEDECDDGNIIVTSDTCDNDKNDYGKRLNMYSHGRHRRFNFIINNDDIMNNNLDDYNHRVSNKRSTYTTNRVNRADYVADSELDDVLTEIDPQYKYRQLSADIPAMIASPIKKNYKKFKDTSNLITDKDDWARTIILDACDTFTDAEHELFVKAYLKAPKNFGKISKLMGGLRKPDDCIKHYYNTKLKTNYAHLIKQRNKDRMKKRKKPKQHASDDSSYEDDSTYTESISTIDSSH